MLAAILPWQQQALLCFVGACLYQGSVLIRNGGKDAEQGGLAAQAGCSQGCPLTLLRPWHELWELLWEGFGDQSEISALFYRRHLLGLTFLTLLTLTFPPPFLQRLWSWEHFQHCLMPEGTGMSQPWCAQLSFLRAQAWRRPLAQTKFLQSKPAGFCTGWEPPLGNTNCTRSFPSPAKLSEGICACPEFLVPEAEASGKPCSLLCLGLQCGSASTDIPRIALVRLFGELIKFPAWQGALSWAR